MQLPEHCVVIVAVLLDDFCTHDQHTGTGGSESGPVPPCTLNTCPGSQDQALKARLFHVNNLFQQIRQLGNGQKIFHKVFHVDIVSIAVQFCFHDKTHNIFNFLKCILIISFINVKFIINYGTHLNFNWLFLNEE